MSVDQWFKAAVIYELHVRSFCDSNADGIGDFNGLREKLGYFEDLGVNTLWLLPFYPSPLRDDGYDIADYYSVNPSYGTLEDFQAFLNEAHHRGLRVITELVINHTSDQNAWFQRARHAPKGSEERDFYVWSDTPKKYEDARIIFMDFESSNWAWDPVAQAYYWHRFYSHQPDLNFDNPRVHEAVFDMIDFWLGMGVDGLRLDAVPYLYEREGTMCENLPETHQFLRRLRRHVDEHFPDRMLLAEANQWPEDAVTYFGTGDECHMAFHFPMMPRLFMALQMEDRFPLVDIIDQTPVIPENCQWAIFLRNHDELTLEMVTDEERDYMYRIYARDARARINLGIRRRLAPLLDNSRRKIELINSLLFSMPGTPIIYYGDEIGMGDNFYLGDRNGVRTPMQWSADRNAGFSRSNPQQLFLPVIIDPEFHYETVNVDTQQKNLSSLFWWMRRILGVRQRHPALSFGAIEFLQPKNAKVLAYMRHYEGETILIIANLSRFAQAVRVELSRFQGCTLEELFGGSSFPEITDAPYLFTLGPHNFYWLQVCPPAERRITDQGPTSIRTLHTKPEWDDSLRDVMKRVVLSEYLARCRWFGGKDRVIRSVRVVADLVVTEEDIEVHFLFVEVVFTEGVHLVQVMPLHIGYGEAGNDSMVAHFADGKSLLDSLSFPSMQHRLLKMIALGEVWEGEGIRLRGVCWNKEISGELLQEVNSRLMGAEQSNTSIVYGELWTLKFLRRFELGSNPEVEILRALEEQKFPHVPRYLGEIHGMVKGEDGVVGLLTSFVPNQGDGWVYALDAVGDFFEHVLAFPPQEQALARINDIAGVVFPERMRQLGVLTAQLHCNLRQITTPTFKAEPFTMLYQRSLYQSMRSLARRMELELTKVITELSEPIRNEVEEWLQDSPRLFQAYSELLKRKITATKIRVHGDYHLGQVLNTGKDFVIIDFEGEPRRPIGERMLKRSALVDVAGMLRSFDYVVEIGLEQQRPEDLAMLQPWASGWLEIISRAFLDGYLSVAKQCDFLPDSDEDFLMLRRLFLLDKAVYEVGYELSYRPAYLKIPLRAVRRLLS